MNIHKNILTIRNVHNKLQICQANGKTISICTYIPLQDQHLVNNYNISIINKKSVLGKQSLKKTLTRHICV